jgi:cell surface protein SprA
LYNKSKFLKKISSPAPPKADKPKNAVTGEDMNPDNPKNKDKISKANKTDDKKKDKEPSLAARLLIRPLLLIQRARITYVEDFTTIVPGFVSTHRILGQDKTFTKPGMDFSFGMQPTSIWLDDAAGKGWVTDNIFLSQQVQQTHKKEYSGKMNIVPFADFNIEVDINKTISENFSENFKMDTIGGSFKHLNPMRVGTMTMSYLPIKTWKDSETNPAKQYTSFNFDNFSNSRRIISERLGAGLHEDTTGNRGYTDGFGRAQQDVLVNSFIAAYTGQNAGTMKLITDVRSVLPAPNWRVTYNGLQKLKMFSKIFTSFSLTHAYKSTLTINRFATDLDFQNNPTQKDPNSKNFYSTFEVPDMLINEQFNPLLGLDMRFKNDLSARFNYKSSRNLSMSFNDYTLASTTTEEITLGIGYRIKNLKAQDIFKGKKRKEDEKKNPPKKKEGADNYFDFGKTIPKHEWNIQFDFSLRDDKTINRILDQGAAIATRGMRTLRIAPSIDYILNNRLTIRAFFDMTKTTPAVMNAFPITNMRGGVVLRFSLTQ